MGRERLGVAEGASNESYESLRQKDSYMTRLWRVSDYPTTNEESRKVKLSGTRTEVPFMTRESLSIFLEN